MLRRRGGNVIYAGIKELVRMMMMRTGRERRKMLMRSQVDTGESQVHSPGGGSRAGQRDIVRIIVVMSVDVARGTRDIRSGVRVEVKRMMMMKLMGIMGCCCGQCCDCLLECRVFWIWPSCRWVVVVSESFHG